MRPRPAQIVPSGSVALIALCLAVSGVAADPSPLAPESGPWDTGKGFEFDVKPNKTRRSVSGIACRSQDRNSHECLVIFDEGVEARFANIEDGRIEPLAEVIRLAAVDELDVDELDAEGAAVEGNIFYVTGSHAAKRNSCASNPGSRFVLRLERDASGKPNVSDDNGRLWALMKEQTDTLAPHVGENKCLGTKSVKENPKLRGVNGVNIEGLAVRAGRLFFGFRGPAEDGRVSVLAVEAASLFSGGETNEVITLLKVGSGRGIRDIQAVSDGFLLLLGPDDDEGEVRWSISLWDGNSIDGESTPRELAELDVAGVTLDKCDEEIKPEALAVLEESVDSYRTLILSDGMCDGGPLLFRIPR